MWRVAVIVYSLIFFGLWSVTLYAAEQQTVMVTAPSAAPENVPIGLTHQQENPEPSTGAPNDERGTLFKVPADQAGNAPMRIYVLVWPVRVGDIIGHVLPGPEPRTVRRGQHS
jgi:hypothetical protein